MAKQHLYGVSVPHLFSFRARFLLLLLEIVLILHLFRNSFIKQAALCSFLKHVVASRIWEELLKFFLTKFLATISNDGEVGLEFVLCVRCLRTSFVCLSFHLFKTLRWLVWAVRSCYCKRLLCLFIRRKSLHLFVMSYIMILISGREWKNLSALN